MADAVASHYARAELLDAILDGLKRQGRDLARLTPLDLPAIDEFHIRGREATVELAQLALMQTGSRVLAPGGRLVFHDVFRGEGGALHFPVPWADDESISFLTDVAAARAAIEAAGLQVTHWDDLTQRSLDWIAAMSEKRKASARSLLGLHLLMGENAGSKSDNNVANLREGRIVVVQARCEKR